MSGPIELTSILSIAVVAAATDLARGKIYNWLTLPGILTGLGYAAGAGGSTSLLAALGGVGTAFALFAGLYVLRVMAAGDVKLLMALGAWSGSAFVLRVGILSIVLGGIIAAVVLVFRGELRGFIQRLRDFLYALFIKELSVVPMKVNSKSKIPFGVAISIAAIWVAL